MFVTQLFMPKTGTLTKFFLYNTPKFEQMCTYTRAAVEARRSDILLGKSVLLRLVLMLVQCLDCCNIRMHFWHRLIRHGKRKQYKVKTKTMFSYLRPLYLACSCIRLCEKYKSDWF